MKVCVLRFGTAFGLSSRMRLDLAVNAMTTDAVRTGYITVRSPNNWRPFIHCKDIAAACVSSLHWRLDEPTLQLLNVGSTPANYRLLDVAEVVQSLLPGSKLQIEEAVADIRNYRVSFSRIENHTNWRPRLSIRDGVVEVAKWVRDNPLFT
jgi:nucleoside-diphosphate-sugar epimerase